MKFSKIGFIEVRLPEKRPAWQPLCQAALTCNGPSRSLFLVLVFTTACHLSGGGAWAQSDTIPPALSSYKGREIAQTMHYLGAPWLTRESRDREEDCATMLEALRIKRGDTVCDMGCGNGFYSLRIAPLVGETGQVIAVDIQREMLEMLKERAVAERIANIQTLLGTVIDPKLEPESIDLMLMVDVYHEFSHPEQMLAAIRRSLKPSGRVALVEFRAEDPAVPIKPLHKMSKAQIMKEFAPNGFKLVDEFDRLPWQHLMFFERDDAGKN
jgi:ubiquinone/menaquinone biosynthesis C-methylase UbiE